MGINVYVYSSFFGYKQNIMKQSQNCIYIIIYKLGETIQYTSLFSHGTQGKIPMCSFQSAVWTAGLIFLNKDAQKQIPSVNSF